MSYPPGKPSNTFKPFCFQRFLFPFMFCSYILQHCNKSFSIPGGAGIGERLTGKVKGYLFPFYCQGVGKAWNVHYPAAQHLPENEINPIFLHLFILQDIIAGYKIINLFHHCSVGKVLPCNIPFFIKQHYYIRGMQKKIFRKIKRLQHLFF